MLVASDKLKKALDSDERYITPTVKIYFDGPNKDPMIFSDDHVIDIEIIEELANETDNPIGNVCSNELNLELLNINNMFTLTNKNSILANKIIPNVKCEVEFNVFISEDNDVEIIKMGTFFLEDCKSSSATMSATITAYDRLYSLNDLDVPDIPIQHNITVKELFELFFNRLGLVKNKDYIIDNSLSTIINTAWFESTTVGECIKLLSTSCACLVYVDRNNKIVVRDQLKLTVHDYSLSEENQIYNIVNVPAYNEMSSSVELEYMIPSVSDEITELLNVSDLTLSPGITEFKNLKFSKYPVLTVMGIEIINGSKVSVIDYNINANSMDILIQNLSGQEQNINLKADGKVINTTTAYVRKRNESMVDLIGERPLKVSSYLLQNNSVLQEYTNILLSMIATFGNTIDIELRGNPLIEIADIIDLYAPSYNIEESVIPIKNTYRISDGLSSTMLCIKSNTRKYKDTVFISPGLVIESER